VTNVMYADIPLVTIAIVTVGEAAGGIVLLQYDHFFTHFAQAGSGGKPAYAGADNNGVVRAFQPVRAVPVADAECAWFGAAHRVNTFYVVCPVARKEPPGSSWRMPPARHVSAALRGKGPSFQ